MAMERRRRLFGARRGPAGLVEPVGPELQRAGAAFAATLTAVEGAKASLVTVVRSGRAPGAPLAEALAGFEAGLREADEAMLAWRVPDVEDAWAACRSGLDDSLVRAEAFRLRRDPPEIYEHLIAALEDLMDPLDPFEDASERWRALGVRVY